LPNTALTSVVRVLAKLEPGGAQLSVLRVIAGLKSLGLESRLLVGWASPEGLALAGRMGVEVETYGADRGIQWKVDRGFAAWLKPRLAGAPVVHAHMFGGWWASARAVEPGTVLVASEHNALSWPGGQAPLNLRSGLARVDRFYAHGPGARESMLGGGLDEARLFDGSSPIIDLDVTPDSTLPTPRIVFAGRLHSDKGPDVLLEALRLLPDAPPALLLGEGPLEPELRERIVAYGLSSRVKLVGWQNRPATFLSGASLAVIPSREESWSQTAVLSMALGVPVIGTDVDGLPNTLAQGRGLVVPPEDPVALAAAIDDVLTGRTRTDLVGARAYAETFTVGRISAMYAASYRELHDGRVAAATREPVSTP
jgi:glycosyltransferase involved in cell wall biosynthesis